MRTCPTQSTQRRPPSPESLAALSAGNKEALRELVYQHIHSCKCFGAIADEATEAMAMSPNCVAPRFTELARAGRIVKLADSSGKVIRRKTRLGCSAVVYVAVKFAPVRTVSQSVLFDFVLEHRDDA